MSAKAAFTVVAAVRHASLGRWSGGTHVPVLRRAGGLRLCGRQPQRGRLERRWRGRLPKRGRVPKICLQPFDGVLKLLREPQHHDLAPPALCCTAVHGCRQPARAGRPHQHRRCWVQRRRRWLQLMHRVGPPSTPLPNWQPTTLPSCCSTARCSPTWPERRCAPTRRQDHTPLLDPPACALACACVSPPSPPSPSPAQRGDQRHRLWCRRRRCCRGCVPTHRGPDHEPHPTPDAPSHPASHPAPDAPPDPASDRRRAVNTTNGATDE